MARIPPKQSEDEFSPAHKSLTIPFVVLRYAVEKKKFSPIQVFVATKHLFGHKFFDIEVNLIAKLTGRHQKTVRCHLNWLAEEGWIGFDCESGIYFIRSWKYIRTILQDETRSGYYFQCGKIQDFKAFAIASTFDHLIALQKLKKWRAKTRESRQMGSSKQTGLQSRGFYPIANKAFSKIYMVSEATASRYRSLASRSGFLRVIEQLHPTSLPSSDRAIPQIWMGEYGVPIVFKAGAYWKQGISLVQSNMIRKKLPRLEGKN